MTLTGRWTTLTAAAAGTATALAAAYGITAVATRSASPDVALRARIDVGTQPAALAAVTGGVWVAVSEGLVRVGTDATPDQTIEGPGAFAFSFLAASPRALWVQQGGASTTAPLAIVRIDPSTGATKTLAAAEEMPHGIAYDDGVLWAVDIAGNVVKIDAETGEELIRTSLGSPLWAVAVGEGAVWAGGEAGVVRLDPATGRVVARIDAPYTVDLAIGHGFVWAAGARDASKAAAAQAAAVAAGANPKQAARAAVRDTTGIARIDPDTNTVAGHTTFTDAHAVAVGPRAVWAIAHVGATLVRLDPATGAIEQTISTGKNQLADVATTGEVVWVAEGGTDGALLRFS